MPYSFLHIAALRNDVNGAIKYLEGGDKDEVHVWPGMSLFFSSDPVCCDALMRSLQT